MLVRIPAGLERKKERREGNFQGSSRLHLKLPSGGMLPVPSLCVSKEWTAKMAHALPLLLFAVLNALSCHSEVRARDPDTEEEEAVGLGGWAKQMPGTFGTAHLTKPHEHQHHGISASMPSVGTPQNSAHPSRETVHPPTHRGNWCPYVNHRVITSAVLYGTETKTVKSVNPCPDGTPDCQLNKYRLSSRPVYRQKQTVLYALQWKCCPGYGGHNCQEKEDKMVTDLLEDMSWDDKPLQEAPIRDSSLPVMSNQSPVGAREGIPTSQPLPLLDSSILLSMHQLMSTMMNQLQPVLESFNQTLMHLSSQVDILSQDLQQLRLEQEDNRSNRGEAHSGAFEETLDLQVRQMKTQLDTQRAQMEKALQTQQELLHHNITKLKEEMDDQIRQSMDAQVNLQSLTGLVEEVRLDQKRLEKALQREHVESGKQSGSQPAQDSRMWQAITRLDENAQSNSAQLSSLSETSKDTARAVEDLQTELLTLQQRVEKVKQRSEVHFAEIGLEVEATRVRVLNSISELTTNVSAHDGQLTEIELNLYNIYNQLQRNDSPTAEQACNCKSIGDSLVRLELEVANVTQLAMENQLALENAELERNQGLWATEIEDLHQGLLNMKESLAFEQGRSRILNDNMSQLKASLLHSQQEIRDLRERDEAKLIEIRGLSATFSSLLNDAVRHSEVLEVLLGEEVLEFTHWSHNQQKEFSIPNLLQKMHLMQQKIASHDRSLVSLRRKHPEKDVMNSDDPVAYSKWTNTKSQVRDLDSHQASLTDPPTGEDDVDYSVSDFWSLGKQVEQLAGRVYLLEERCGNCTEPSGGSVVELQANVTSLNQSLENHLRTFQKLFSQTEEFTSSARSLNLDEVWKLVRRKEGKKRRGHQNQEQLERGGEKSSSRRSKRYSEAEHASLQHSPVVFITSLDHSRGPNGDLRSRNVSVNHDAAFSATSEVFQAPVTGLYLFLVTLDFERGHSLAVLKRSGVPVASLRQEQREKGGTVSRGCLLELRQGETVTLEMMHGSLRKTQPGDNTLSGLLLFITEYKDMQ
ncbi:multimerin-2-like isoform X2 [Myxocyprinus asiaticus]|uniref:multimerin-2-like isoform X2 n=1 Tax=Myxocyprinus asiaticus TaxID=70543 RepID=UPI002221FB57|nr:multimerin-2-like isoform X2 [Myxocyprinus asiaticus]